MFGERSLLVQVLVDDRNRPAVRTDDRERLRRAARQNDAPDRVAALTLADVTDMHDAGNVSPGPDGNSGLSLTSWTMNLVVYIRSIIEHSFCAIPRYARCARACTTTTPQPPSRRVFLKDRKGSWGRRHARDWISTSRGV